MNVDSYVIPSFSSLRLSNVPPETSISSIVNPTISCSLATNLKLNEDLFEKSPVFIPSSLKIVMKGTVSLYDQMNLADGKLLTPKESVIAPAFTNIVDSSSFCTD